MLVDYTNYVINCKQVVIPTPCLKAGAFPQHSGKYVDHSAWKAEHTGDMWKDDADRINKQMDGTVQDIDVDPAETSVIKPIIDNIDADVK